MKNTDLRSYIFLVVFFLSDFNKILSSSSGTSVVFFKSPLEKRFLTIFHRLSSKKMVLIPDFTFQFLSNEFKNNASSLIN